MKELVHVTVGDGMCEIYRADYQVGNPGKT